MEVSIKVLTLNCWGLKYVSKLRKERFNAIAEYLSHPPGSGYDVVFLQEVWLNKDYDEFKTKLTRSSEMYPYSHYFDNGIIGSGTCIFSKVRLQDANYHEFAMNGYPTNFWHGDWFASKGIGVCQIRLNANHINRRELSSDYFDIHLYVSHYHANYDPDNDIYLGHRVIHAFESAQWIKLTSSAADLTIYAGDFNTEPTSLPYRILRNVAALKDAWEICSKSKLNGSQSMNQGGTNEVPSNSFCSVIRPSTSQEPNLTENGLRIDYVMYSEGPDTTVTPLSCSLPLPNRVPGQNYSYSDHEAVDAVLKLSRKMLNEHKDDQRIQRQTVRDFKRAQSIETRSDCVKSVQEAIKVMDRSLESVDRSQIKYAAYALLSAIFLIVTFVPSGLTGFSVAERITLDVCLFLPRLALAAATIIFGLMSSLFSKRERNAFRAVKNQLNLVLQQDVEDQISDKFQCT